MRCWTVPAALCLPWLATGALAVEAQGVGLAPHRAVYDLSLARSGGPRGIEGAQGRIALEFTGDSCTGYALKYRQVTVLQGGETGARTSDLRNATFEDGEGQSFRFKTDSQMGGRRRSEVDGEAQRRDGAITVKLTQPSPDRLDLPADVLFPTAHMKRVIEAARAGETTVTAPVFDGSEDGRKAYDTLAVIGRRIEPGQERGLDEASRQDPLLKLPRWPVTLSYFSPGDGERTPIYVISFELYDNGVSRALRLDYGDFALKGDLQSLQFLPESSCQR